MGQADDGVYLVENVADVERLQVRNPDRLAFVSQTTLSVDDCREIIDALKRRFPSIAEPRKQDICYATQNRQDAVKFMAPQCDLVLVIGSPNSSNSNRLREVAEKMGCEARLIGSADAAVRPEPKPAAASKPRRWSSFLLGGAAILTAWIAGTGPDGLFLPTPWPASARDAAPHPEALMKIDTSP